MTSRQLAHKKENKRRTNETTTHVQVLHGAVPLGQLESQVRHLEDVRPQLGIGSQDVTCARVVRT